MILKGVVSLIEGPEMNNTKRCKFYNSMYLHKNAATKHPTKQQLYGHLPPILKTIQVR